MACGKSGRIPGRSLNRNSRYINQLIIVLQKDENRVLSLNKKRPLTPERDLVITVHGKSRPVAAPELISFM